MKHEITLQGVNGDRVVFEPLTEISSATCQVTSRIGGRTISDNLPLLGVESFCSALRAWVRTGVGEAVLEGAYDFRLGFSREAGQRHWWAALYQADFIMPDNLEHGRLAMSGDFMWMTERWGSLPRLLRGTIWRVEGLNEKGA